MCATMAEQDKCIRDKGETMAKIIVNNENKKSTIAPEIYGHFSEHLGRCIYEGLFVGENSDIPNVNGMRTDVVDALKEMKIPVLRWPGGCFADEYHWMDGIGPKEKRKKMINTHWGGVVEDNSFGTHEFFELCRQLGCKTYVNGNLGSGTVREMSEWVEYITFNGVSPMADLRKENGHEEPWTIDYFGVGNENWGCGGNMRPEHYADEYRRYQTYVRNYAGNQPINKICCGPNVDDYEWTKKVMATCFDHCDPKLHGLMDGLSLHYYTLPETEDDWNIKGSATEFTEDIFYQTLKRGYFMEELINRHGAIMDEYDPDKNIGLIVDEWGIWSDVEPGTNPGFLYQQSTVRDALVAGVTLNIFNKHCDRVKMANIAQMVNVLQAVILTDGAKMICTPTYHVFELYKAHHDANYLPSAITCGECGGVKQLTATASEKEGVITLTATNTSCTDALDVVVHLSGASAKNVTARILTGDMHDKNTFEDAEKVTVKPFDAVRVTETGLKMTLPACSVVEVTIRG